MAKAKRQQKTSRGPRSSGSASGSPKAKPSHRAAKPRPSSRVQPAPESASGEAGVFGVDVEPSSVERTLEKMREELSYWVKKGRYTKVRLKLRGQPILPDIPVAAFLAAEAVTFWWAGLLRSLLVHLGAKAVLDVELVSDADLEVARGKAALLAGDLDHAMLSFEKALAMDRDSAAAHLNLGIAYKLKGDLEKASELLRRTEQLDPQGPTGEEARRLLDQLAERARGQPPPGGGP